MIYKTIQSTVLLFTLIAFCSATATAQSGSIEGQLINQQSDEPIIGGNIFIESLQKGASTDADGNFVIEDVPYGSYKIRASYVGYSTKNVDLTVDQEINSITITLVQGIQELDDVVVTAYGVERQVNELPYSAQKVNTEEVANSGDSNLLSAMSGRVAGMQVESASGIGSSTDIVLRGYSSLTGNNQALFVVDGVPYANERFNTSAIENAQQGYDYGTTGVDINPENIESITVLKGPSAAALYGSRASNGAIVIETKKGAPQQESVDISFSSSVGLSRVDPGTFPEYQDEYGAGYAESFFSQDIDEDGTNDNVARYTADASWGPAFDSDLMVYQWDSFYSDSPTFQQATPWIAAKNGPLNFFRTGTNVNNSLNINGNVTEQGYYTIGYDQTNQSGVLPNSTLDTYKLNFKGGYEVSEKLQVSASINFTQTEGKGRPERGYNSILTSFRGFREVNVDINEQKAAYFRNRLNTTWNLQPDKSGPFFFNNPYWDQYENYETDGRKRYVGHAEIKYDLFDWLSFTGRAAIDNYSQLIEERNNLGSAAIPYYDRRTEDFTEYNFDLLANYNKQLSEKISVDGVVGANIRRNYVTGINASTNGGLKIARLYSLSNSVSPINFPFETDRKLGVNGYFASLNLNYDDFLNLSLTGRRDKSSSLPEDKNVYYYPSASVGFTFSEFINASWFSFGKIRGSWADVGKTAPPYSLTDIFLSQTNFGSVTLYELPGTKNNANLKPEKTKAWEIGLQLGFINDRIYLDAAYYDQNSVNQIIPVDVTPASGFTSKFINAGNIENRGIEVQIQGRPVVASNFSWNISANWSKNINKVKELAPGVDFFQFASLQGGVSIGAIEGGTYGAIRGSQYVYHENGQPIVGEDGNYLETSSTSNVLGTMNPDWRGGVSNEFKYKNISLSVLVDVRWGGDIFSLDQYYGQGTGVYPESVGLNRKGNPKRDPVSEGGGILQDGVTQDGSPNETYTALEWNSGYGYRANPHEPYVYDGSYIKLREVRISYSLPRGLIEKTGILDNATVSAVGRNLWIMHKNIPYSDPEQSLAAGNLQGYQNSVLPATRNVTINLKLNF